MKKIPNPLLLWAIFTSLFFSIPPAQAVDSMALELGNILEEDGELVRLSLQWDWQKRWFTQGDWFVSGYWEADLGYWRSRKKRNNRERKDELYEIGFSPVFRWQRRPNSHHFSPYLEASIGAHLLSQAKLNGKLFSTNFQFGSHIGLGFQIDHFDISYRFQHLSNADIKKPNLGIEFHLLRLGYRF